MMYSNLYLLLSKYDRATVQLSWNEIFRVVSCAIVGGSIGLTLLSIVRLACGYDMSFGLSCWLSAVANLTSVCLIMLSASKYGWGRTGKVLGMITIGFVIFDAMFLS